MKLDLLVRDGLICRQDLLPARGAIGVRDGRIAVVAAGAEGLDATDVIDAAGRLVMPGMIDPHIHIGHGAPHASEFWTEGRSAVIGGVTSMLTYYRRHPFNYLDLVPERHPCLERIDRLNPTLSAFITVDADEAPLLPASATSPASIRP